MKRVCEICGNSGVVKTPWQEYQRKENSLAATRNGMHRLYRSMAVRGCSEAQCIRAAPW